MEKMRKMGKMEKVDKITEMLLELDSLDEMMAIMKKVIKIKIGKHYSQRGLDKCIEEGGGDLPVEGILLGFFADKSVQSKSWKKLRNYFIDRYQEDIDRLVSKDGQPRRPRIKVSDSITVIVAFGILCRMGIIPELTVEDQYLFLTRCFYLNYSETTVKRILGGINLSSNLFSNLSIEIKRVKKIKLKDITEG